MNTKSIFSALAFCLSLSAVAQEETLINGRGCGTEIPSEEWNIVFNKQVEEFKRNQALAKTAENTYTIPVVVHVIYGAEAVGTFPNLSQAQINSQISVLNADFAGTGLNAGNVPSIWAGLVSNTGVTFCMAKYNPDGDTLAEPGIDRVSYNALGFPNPAASTYSTPAAFQTYMNGTIKPATIWDPTRYLNIWVSNRPNTNGLLGYATFPATSGLSGIPGAMGTATTDGIWVWSRAFGTVGTLSSPYNRGRTTTHEIGHWLGLRHIWGDSNCGTDYCSDTPPSQTQNGGCPGFPYKSGVCSGNTTGEMTMNFMDYTNDQCAYMFTPNQTSRIHAAMTNGIYRKDLTASSANLCTFATPTVVPLDPPVAQFALSALEGCIYDPIEISNSTTGSDTLIYEWLLSDDTNILFTSDEAAQTPTLYFLDAGTYTITLVTSNSAGSDTLSQEITIGYCGRDVGIAKAEALSKKISLVPNPSSGMVNIHAKLPDNTGVELALYNMLGELLLTKTYHHISGSAISLDLSAYPSGVYSLLINTNEGKVNKKLILSK